MPEELGPEPCLEPGLEPGSEPGSEPGVGTEEGEKGGGERAFEGGFPLRKCRSSFDIAMDSLRKEIVSGD